ncbi:RNA-directed DNA polymerase [Phytophthora megakarya]|uniref:RNA-directed DNA polymerase n=1 Tax=Phytophthora megakarya TaxID=4795 RepID=A0A225VLQ3_9STRA|nr:RNA-directed DNA polymerase [Phytophthora megakarya]
MVAVILDWFKRFSLPETWESDNGSHFKAEVMTSLCKRPKANQSFVPVYTQWINETIERINRDILQVLRVMLLEYQLDTRNWFYLLPMIQPNLNHSPVPPSETMPR